MSITAFIATTETKTLTASSNESGGVRVIRDNCQSAKRIATTPGNGLRRVSNAHLNDVKTHGQCSVKSEVDH